MTKMSIIDVCTWCEMCHKVHGNVEWWGAVAHRSRKAAAGGTAVIGTTLIQSEICSLFMQTSKI
jgi:hypothetical protein